VVTTSDLIALGALRGLHEKNIKVPDEVSVTGFDNIDYAQYSIPSLTTVNQPRIQMGEIAFSYLVNSDIDVSRNNKVLLISDFIIRESVKE
jgi:DNA-binding LacI/PurR family transcriptional regulator